MSRIVWIAGNALPFAVILMRLRLSPVVAFAFVILVLAATRAFVLRRSVLLMAFFVSASLLSAAAVLALFDALGFEHVGLAVAHIAAGCVLVLAESRDRLVGIAWWMALSIALAIAAVYGWHPAGDVSLFAGYRELASFPCLVAVASAANAAGRVGSAC